jgi:hypothetical protein
VTSNKSLFHWNGKAWSEHELEIGAGRLWGCGSDTLWVTGAYDVARLEIDGEFTIFDLHVEYSPLKAIWGASSGHVLVAGHGGTLLRRAK